MTNEIVNWQGSFRSSLQNAMIAPRPAQEKLPIWIGVGGTPESAIRAGRLGTGLALAILGGDPKRFKPLVDLYRQAGLEAGHSNDDLKVAVTGHTFIAKTSQQAKDEFYPYYANYWEYVNKQRGMGAKMSRSDFDIWPVLKPDYLSEVPNKSSKKFFSNMNYLATNDLLHKWISEACHFLGLPKVLKCWRQKWHRLFDGKPQSEIPY